MEPASRSLPRQPSHPATSNRIENTTRELYGLGVETDHLAPLGHSASTIGPSKRRLRHGRTKEESYVIKHARLMEQVAVQYARRPPMLEADRDIIAEPILREDKRSPAPLELWLDCNVPIMKLSTTAATAAITKTHKKITSFFRRKRPPRLPGEQPQTEQDLSSMEAPGPICMQRNLNTKHCAAPR